MTSFREARRHASRQLDRDGTDLLGLLDDALDMHLRGDTRAAAIHALTAVIGSIEEKFVETNLGTDRTIPLRKLRDGLDDLDRGLTPDMLQPARRKGGPTPAPAEERRMRTIAVLMVEAGLVEKKFETLKDGFKKVASDADRAAGYEVTADAVRRWRGNIRDDESAHALEKSGLATARDEAAALYRDFADAGFREVTYSDLLQVLKNMAKQGAKSGIPLGHPENP